MIGKLRRLTALVLVLALAAAMVLYARTSRAEGVLWLDRVEARPWLSALSRAAERTNLPVGLLAELIGLESGFRNIKNPKSSARGFGQQINGNTVMWLRGLDRNVPEESILGAAIEFRIAMDRTGSIGGAAHAYGTTTHMSPYWRRATVARLEIAARRFNVFVVAQLP